MTVNDDQQTDQPKPKEEQFASDPAWDNAPDPEAEAVARAKAEVEAEERGEKPAEQRSEAQPQNEDKDAGQHSEDTDQGDGKTPDSIPYPRFSQVNKQLDATKRAMEYLRRQNEALMAQRGQQQAPATSQTQDPPPEAPKSPEELIQAANTQIDEAAERYDRGEISMAEFKRSEREAQDQIWQARQSSLQPQQPAREGLGDEYVLAEHAARLEAENPWIGTFDPNDLKRLAVIARDTLEREGQRLGDTAHDTMLLREKVSELTHLYGPAWYPDAIAGRGPQQPGNGARSESQAAKDGRKAMETAASFPVDTQQAGRVARSEQITEDDVLKMSEDEIMALPASERARLLGTSA